MRNWTKAALLGAGLIGALAAGGCASDYYGEDGYGRSYYDDSGHRHYYRDRDSYRDRDDRSKRVRVCDDDGDDCHWEYQRQ